MLVVANATPAVHYGYRVGVPEAGQWTEILNTDAVDYGGSGVGNLGLVVTEEQQWHGFPQSLALTVPRSPSSTSANTADRSDRSGRSVEGEVGHPHGAEALGDGARHPRRPAGDQRHGDQDQAGERQPRHLERDRRAPR